MSIPSWFSSAKEGMRLTSDIRSYSFFNDIQENRFNYDLKLWSDVANIPMTIYPDNGNLSQFYYGGNTPAFEYTRVAIGDIANPLINGINKSSGFGLLYHEIFIDPSLEGISDFQLGSTANDVLIHELGHSLIGGPLPGGHIEGTEQQTIMGPYASNSASIWHPSTPMSLDIDAAISIYGAATNTRVGDTRYGFNAIQDFGVKGSYYWERSWPGSAFDFDYNKRPLVTIYDNGGIDQLDASGFLDGAGNPRGVLLDLHPGAESKIIGGATFAVIYKTTLIENAIGSPAADQIYGNDADNNLFGDNGNDVIIGNGGNDTIDGGLGYDVAIYNGPRSAFEVTRLSNGEFTVNHIASPVSFGSTNQGHDILHGIEEIRFLDSRLTTQTVGSSQQGSTVESNFYGSAHDDVYSVTHVGDAVVEDAGGGFDTVYSSTSYTLPVNVEALIFTGSADLNGNGNEGANVLIGNAGHNVLAGLAGDDIYGVDGNGDTVVETASGGYDEVYSSGNYTMVENTETLFLTGSAVYGTGNAANNALIGNDLDNIIDAAGGTFEFINGGAGNDLLIGGAGHDEIMGAAGNDTFRFTAVSDVFNGPTNVGDFFYDFTPEQDHIQFNAAAFGIGTAANPLVEGVSFVNGTDVTSAVPTLLYTQANGTLFYDADGTGAQAPIVMAVLNGTPTLHASDFTFY